MIECSLQEAVKRCKENGGAFCEKEDQEVKWELKTQSKITCVDDGGDFCLEPLDFESTWIYEPQPKQSAFQKWQGSVSTSPLCSPSESLFRKLRKEGWNAAIDAVLNKCLPGDFSDPDMAYRSAIKELKE